MPATAGRVRMPANNRVHSSAALQTHDIWRSAIGYDPYAPTTDDNKSKPDNSAGDAYANFRGLLTLARITNSNCDETRGACKKCGRVGHLTYQCRNFLSFKDAEPTAEGNDDAALRNAEEIMERIKKGDEIEEKRGSDDDEEEDDDEISSSDSDVDPEMERIIAERYGVKMSGKALKKRYTSSDDDDERRKKRSHHHHHHHHHKKRRRTRHHRRHYHEESDSDRGYKRKKRSHHHKERRSVLSSGSESTGSSSEEDERRGRGRHRERSRERKD